MAEVDCDLILIEPRDSVHEGCPILTKDRNVMVTKGQCGIVQWPMRFSNGDTADLSECFPTESSESGSESESVTGDVEIRVRFQLCGEGKILAGAPVTVVDAEAGLVQFPIPNVVCQFAGIYKFQIALLEAGTDHVLFSDSGLLSVETGLWGDQNQTSGPPTLNEIRMHLRDRELENDLLRDVEFDDAEIMFAILRPVQEFNETPPPIPPFSCRTFPFKYFWLNAIVAELMKTAAHHYVRNKMQSTSGGLSIDDKAKDADYLKMASYYTQEWKEFIVQKKVEINVGRGYNTQTSLYSFPYGY